MAAYVINVCLIFTWAFFLLLLKPTDKKKAAYCAVVCAQWVLLSGLRSDSVGADTGAYRRIFENVKATSWSKIFSNIWDYICGKGNVKDPGYALLEKTFQIFFKDYQLFLVFIALVFMISLAVWVYNNSSMPCMSFIIFSTLFYEFYAITGHRQTLATALVVFMGYHFIKKKKLVPFLVLCLFAFFIHKSSICFIPFYFLARKKITKKYLAVFALVSVVFIILGRTAYGPVAEFIGYDVEEYQLQTDNSTYVILICIIMAAAFFFYKQIKKNNPEYYTILYNSMMIGTVFSVLSLQNTYVMRVQQYYTLIIMLMVPEILRAIDKKYRFIPYAAVAAVFIYKLVTTCADYSFFWQ